MKYLFALLVIFPFSLSANESIVCVSDNLQLNIVVHTVKTPTSVSWVIKVIDNVDVAIVGTGLWQKEVESEDAFSSYDDQSAVAYKNKRAVFVMGNDQSIYFPACVNRDTLN